MTMKNIKTNIIFASLGTVFVDSINAFISIYEMSFFDFSMLCSI